MRDDDGEENVPHSQNILIGVLVGSTRIISKERERKRLLSSVANPHGSSKKMKEQINKNFTGISHFSSVAEPK